MKLSAILEPLIAAGVSGDVILATVKAFEAQQTDALERRRESDRIRQERRRHVKSREVTVTGSSHAGVTRVEDNLQNLEIAGQSKKVSFEQEFETEFWPLYPRKVGKGAARKAYVAARKRGVTLEALIAGVKRYAAERASEDPKFTQHASTWLGAEGWDDEPTPKYVPPRAAAPPGQRTMNDVLNELQGKGNAAHPGPTIDASFDRADRGGAANLVQFDAAASRLRS